MSAVKYHSYLDSIEAEERELVMSAYEEYAKRAFETAQAMIEEMTRRLPTLSIEYITLAGYHRLRFLVFFR